MGMMSQGMRRGLFISLAAVVLVVHATGEVSVLSEWDTEPSYAKNPFASPKETRLDTGTFANWKKSQSSHLKEKNPIKAAARKRVMEMEASEAKERSEVEHKAADGELDMGKMHIARDAHQIHKKLGAKRLKALRSASTMAGGTLVSEELLTGEVEELEDRANQALGPIAFIQEEETTYPWTISQSEMRKRSANLQRQQKVRAQQEARERSHTPALSEHTYDADVPARLQKELAEFDRQNELDHPEIALKAKEARRREANDATVDYNHYSSLGETHSLQRSGVQHRQAVSEFDRMVASEEHARHTKPVQHGMWDSPAPARPVHAAAAAAADPRWGNSFSGWGDENTQNPTSKYDYLHTPLAPHFSTMSLLETAESSGNTAGNQAQVKATARARTQNKARARAKRGKLDMISQIAMRMKAREHHRADSVLQRMRKKLHHKIKNTPASDAMMMKAQKIWTKMMQKRVTDEKKEMDKEKPSSLAEQRSELTKVIGDDMKRERDAEAKAKKPVEKPSFHEVRELQLSKRLKEQAVKQLALAKTEKDKAATTELEKSNDDGGSILELFKKGGEAQKSAQEALKHKDTAQTRTAAAVAQATQFLKVAQEKGSEVTLGESKDDSSMAELFKKKNTDKHAAPTHVGHQLDKSQKAALEMQKANLEIQKRKKATQGHKTVEVGSISDLFGKKGTKAVEGTKFDTQVKAAIAMQESTKKQQKERAAQAETAEDATGKTMADLFASKAKPKTDTSLGETDELRQAKASLKATLNRKNLKTHANDIEDAANEFDAAVEREGTEQARENARNQESVEIQRQMTAAMRQRTASLVETNAAVMTTEEEAQKTKALFRKKQVHFPEKDDMVSIGGFSIPAAQARMFNKQIELQTKLEEGMEKALKERSTDAAQTDEGDDDDNQSNPWKMPTISQSQARAMYERREKYAAQRKGQPAHRKKIITLRQSKEIAAKKESPRDRLFSLFGQRPPEAAEKADRFASQPRAHLKHKKAVSEFDKMVAAEEHDKGSETVQSDEDSSSELIPGVTVAPKDSSEGDDSAMKDGEPVGFDTLDLAGRLATLPQTAETSEKEEDMPASQKKAVGNAYERQMASAFESFLKKKQEEYFKKAADGDVNDTDFYKNMVHHFTSSVKTNLGVDDHDSVAQRATELVQQSAGSTPDKPEKTKPEKTVQSPKLAPPPPHPTHIGDPDKLQVKDTPAAEVAPQLQVVDEHSLGEAKSTNTKPANTKSAGDTKRADDAKPAADTKPADVRAIEDAIARLNPEQRQKLILDRLASLAGTD
jgi:hypothetical protein